jgi:hypothetical protein
MMLMMTTMMSIFYFSMSWQLYRWNKTSVSSWCQLLLTCEVVEDDVYRATRVAHLVNVVSYGQSSNDMPTNTSLSCGHLGETTESVGLFLAHSQPYKETLEHSVFSAKIWGISCISSWFRL